MKIRMKALTEVLAPVLGMACAATAGAQTDGDRLSLQWMNTYEGGEPEALSMVVTGDAVTGMSMPLADALAAGHCATSGTLPRSPGR